MGIKTKKPPLAHWNYYLALEEDLEQVARYIEFTQKNFSTYSIELAHLMLAASSEVDVVLKALCKRVKPRKPCDNIDDYRKIITVEFPTFMEEKVSVDRFGLFYKPWENWKTDRNPNWWRSYNKVKHQRDLYFPDANLKNVLNSIGALLITVTYYYRAVLSEDPVETLDMKEVNEKLVPEPKLLRLKEDYYYKYVIASGQ